MSRIHFLEFLKMFTNIFSAFDENKDHRNEYDFD